VLRLEVHAILPAFLYIHCVSTIVLLLIDYIVYLGFSVLCREVNPIFEGNQQHDAHELLVCLLDNIRETCRFLADQQKLDSEQRMVTNSALSCDPLETAVNVHQTSSSNSSKWGVRKSWKRKKVSSSSQKNAASNGLPNGIGPEHPHLMNGGVGTHLSVTGESSLLFHFLSGR
jgi:hypothetical protein